MDYETFQNEFANRRIEIIKEARQLILDEAGKRDAEVVVSLKKYIDEKIDSMKQQLLEALK